MAGDYGARTSFPVDYADAFFYGDFALGVIRSVVLDATGTAVLSAATDFVKFAYDHQALSATTSLGLVARISVMKQFMGKPGYDAYEPMVKTLSAPATISRPANPHWQNIVNNALVPMLQKAVLPGADNAQLLKAAAQQVDSIVNN